MSLIRRYSTSRCPSVMEEGSRGKGVLFAHADILCVRLAHGGAMMGLRTQRTGKCICSNSQTVSGL